MWDRTGRPVLEAVPERALNEHILSWWKPDHDAVLQSLIMKYQWHWYLGASDAIVSATPGPVIDAWRDADPLCRLYAWYNVLMHFGLARAATLGYANAVRPSRRRQCPMCAQEYTEDAFSPPMVRWLGVDHLDCCPPCLGQALYNDGDDTLSDRQVLSFVRQLSAVTACVPDQRWLGRIGQHHNVQRPARMRLLLLLRRRPAVACVKRLYGSWLGALVASGVLASGTRVTSRGIHCLAIDGHACWSLSEKAIDDYLYAAGAIHE